MIKNILCKLSNLLFPQICIENLSLTDSRYYQKMFESLQDSYKKTSSTHGNSSPKVNLAVDAGARVKISIQKTAKRGVGALLLMVGASGVLLTSFSLQSKRKF